jgi:hypothetical protein
MEFGNLNLTYSNAVIMDLLSIDDATRTIDLVEICYKRSEGNVFFLIHPVSISARGKRRFGGVQFRLHVRGVGRSSDF